MKILIVEDSKFTQKVIMTQVGSCYENAEFFTADNGDAGFKTYLLVKPDLVITDLLMPIATGNQLIENIRKTDTKTPIIVISADIQESVKLEINAMGVLAFINKPFNMEKAQRVCELLKEFYNV